MNTDQSAGAYHANVGGYSVEFYFYKWNQKWFVDGWTSANKWEERVSKYGDDLNSIIACVSKKIDYILTNPPPARMYRRD